MADYPSHWAIAGGWALDLFLGLASRSHRDIDVAVCRRDQGTLRSHLNSLQVCKVVDGRLVEWHVGEWLALPIHEIHVRGETVAFELLLNECEGSDWIYRRNERIRRALSSAIRSAGDLPYLAPEIVLLYKAKAPAEIDQADFQRVSPLLSHAQTRWLSHALSICHPEHPWLGRFSRGSLTRS
jgi:hypothetical protein